MQLSKETIDYLRAEIELQYSTDAIGQAWDIYRKGNVARVALTADRKAEAEVLDGKSYKVSLDLDFFAISQCNCDFAGYCPHLAAVFLSVLAAHERPELFIRQLKMHEEETSARESDRKARELKKLNRQIRSSPYAHAVSSHGTGQTATPVSGAIAASSPPEPTETIEQWRIKWAQPRHVPGRTAGATAYEITGVFDTMLQQILSVSSGWRDQTIKTIYKIHAFLYMLELLEQSHAEQTPASQTYAYSYTSTAYMQTLDKWYTQLAETIDTFDPSTVYEKCRGYGEETTAILAPLIERRTALVDWLGLYCMFWSGMLLVPEWLNREEARWVARLGETFIAGVADHPVLEPYLGALHIQILLGRDVAVKQMIDQLPTIPLEKLLPYLHAFSRSGQWTRFVEWLQWLLPVAHQAKRDEFNQLCLCWITAAEQLASEEMVRECVNALVTLLPRSFPVYSDFLLQSELFGEWTELQLAYGRGLDQIDRHELKRVEEADPYLILPIYHYTVEDDIAAKSRQSYKSAVRTLKKLRTLYKKMKQTDRFERYVNHIAKKHSRLRALQEELRKGKFIE